MHFNLLFPSAICAAMLSVSTYAGDTHDPNRTATIYLHGFDPDGADLDGVFGEDMQEELLGVIGDMAGLPLLEDGEAMNSVRRHDLLRRHPSLLLHRGRHRGTRSCDRGLGRRDATVRIDCSQVRKTRHGPYRRNASEHRQRQHGHLRRAVDDRT